MTGTVAVIVNIQNSQTDKNKLLFKRSGSHVGLNAIGYNLCKLTIILYLMHYIVKKISS